MINVGLLLLAVFFQRNVFLVFGAVGILGYLSSLFYRLFADSVLFPVILTLVGVFIILVGILYSRNRQKIEVFLMVLLPQGMQAWLPRHRK